jgi:hypothetical protein
MPLDGAVSGGPLAASASGTILTTRLLRIALYKEKCPYNNTWAFAEATHSARV